MTLHILRDNLFSCGHGCKMWESRCPAVKVVEQSGRALLNSDEIDIGPIGGLENHSQAAADFRKAHTLWNGEKNIGEVLVSISFLSYEWKGHPIGRRKHGGLVEDHSPMCLVPSKHAIFLK